MIVDTRWAPAWKVWVKVCSKRRAESLKPEAHLFTDLGLDSLDAVDMVVYLEEKIKLKVDAERMTQVRTLGDVYKLVEDLIAEKNQLGANP